MVLHLQQHLGCQTIWKTIKPDDSKAIALDELRYLNCSFWRPWGVSKTRATKSDKQVHEFKSKWWFSTNQNTHARRLQAYHPCKHKRKEVVLILDTTCQSSELIHGKHNYPSKIASEWFDFQRFSAFYLVLPMKYCGYLWYPRIVRVPRRSKLRIWHVEPLQRLRVFTRKSSWIWGSMIADFTRGCNSRHCAALPSNETPFRKARFLTWALQKLQFLQDFIVKD